MIGLVILPFYVLLNCYLYSLFVKWINLLTNLLSNEIFYLLFLIITIMLSLLYLFALMIPNTLLKKIFTKIGNYYLGISIYSYIVVIVYSVLKILIICFFSNYNIEMAIISGFICIMLVIMINIYGIINAKIIHVKRYSLMINKQGNNLKQLKIVMLADIHLGYNIGANHVKKMVETINKEIPDIVIIAGDIFDNNYYAMDNHKKIIDLLKKIKTKYGTYAVYGNHDVKAKTLFGFTLNNKKCKFRDTKMDQFMKKSNIKVLKDDCVMIKDSIYIYGRVDYTNNADVIKRKKACDITKKMDKNKTIIVIDHQPKELNQLSDSGVDIDLSGHTHDGQIFPFNIICRVFYKNGYGLKKFGNMYSIVTSGIGLYGPNIRVLTKAEITSIDVMFNN